MTGAMAADDALGELVAKQAITELVYRYCRGVDRVDRELVASCYWPEATDEHGSFLGTRDEYVAWLFDRVLPRYRMTCHFVGNVLVDRLDLDAGRAKCESYGFARHEIDDPQRPEHMLMSGFRYVDDLERRRGEWRIRRRICTLEWTRVDDVSTWWDAPPAHRRGRRDHDDPVYWSWMSGPREETS